MFSSAQRRILISKGEMIACGFPEVIRGGEKTICLR
jgi:hypothetical protein